MTTPQSAVGANAPDDDDDDDTDILLDEEDWEDHEGLERIKRENSGWYVMKLHRYSAKLLREIEEWCGSNCRGEWKKAGWSTGCSYLVALCFEDAKDAVFYRLRWADEVS